MQNEIKNWIEQSEYDLDTAKYNFEGKKFSTAALLVQQSAEKALKALFIKKYKEVPKVHDLVFLAKKLHIPEKLFRYCKEISPFFIQTRYPDAQAFRRHSEFSPEECKDAIKKAEEILKWAKEQA